MTTHEAVAEIRADLALWHKLDAQAHEAEDTLVAAMVPSCTSSKRALAPCSASKSMRSL